MLAQATPRGKAASKASAPANAEDDGTLKFSRDIAPILVGNCIGCHNPKDKDRRAGLDMTTFNGLRQGSQNGQVIVAGKPEESPLILHVKGEEPPKMPPGQRNLAPETIAKIEEWVKQGALLDSGVDPATELSKIAPTPEMLRNAELAKLSPEELDQRVTDAGMERWKKASAQTEPEVTAGKHVILFAANLPEDRAQALVKTMDGIYPAMSDLLGPAADPVLGGPAKLSLYVFADPNSYIEFVRSLERREVELGAEQAHGNLGVEMPYLIALDPLGGKAEPEAEPAKRSTTRRKNDDEPTSSGPERGLAGLLAEQFGQQATAQAGEPPRWLVLGLGTYLASKVEPRSPYFNKLRAETVEQFRLGWTTKVQEALGDEGSDESVRAVGFSMMEWLGSSYKQHFTPFVREMLGGNKKLDDTIKQGFGATREQFLQVWGRWVALHYARGR